jgi:hypothetical protein
VERIGAHMGRIGAHWERLGALLGWSWGYFRCLGVSRGVLGILWGGLGGRWGANREQRNTTKRQCITIHWFLYVLLMTLGSKKKKRKHRSEQENQNNARVVFGMFVGEGWGHQHKQKGEIINNLFCCNCLWELRGRADCQRSRLSARSGANI